MTKRTKTALDEYVTKGALGAKLKRGAELAWASGKAAVGMNRGHLENLDAKKKVAKDFFDHFNRKRWGKDHFNMAVCLFFWTRRYPWYPSEETMEQIIQFARDNFQAQEVPTPPSTPGGPRVDENFERAAARLLWENTTANDQKRVNAAMNVIKQIMSQGKMDTLLKAYQSNNLSRQEVNQFGGYDDLQQALEALDIVQKDPAAKQALAAARAGRSEGSAQAQPQAQPQSQGADEAEGQPTPADDKDAGNYEKNLQQYWEKMLQKMPRDTMTRHQFDELTAIVVSDMIDRGMLQFDKNDTPTAVPTSALGAQMMEFSADLATSDSGSSVDMRVFLIEAKRFDPNYEMIGKLARIGKENNSFKQVMDAIFADRELSTNWWRLLSCFAKSFRIAGERNAHPKGPEGEWVACKRLAKTLDLANFTRQELEEFDTVGEQSQDYRALSQTLRGGAIGEKRLRLLLACFAQHLHTPGRQANNQEAEQSAV